MGHRHILSWFLNSGPLFGFRSLFTCEAIKQLQFEQNMFLQDLDKLPQMNLCNTNFSMENFFKVELRIRSSMLRKMSSWPLTLK